MEKMLVFARVAAARRGARVTGKAVVFARQDVTVGDTGTWLASVPAWRDIPRAGEHIAAGRPVCTVFASADSVAECHAALADRARHVYAALAAWDREVA